jgi:hypothetical protein
MAVEALAGGIAASAARTALSAINPRPREGGNDKETPKVGVREDQWIVHNYLGVSP